MPTSVSRGPITFEDGSTAEDVEVFDDGTWINHGLLARKQREQGMLMRAAADKAERQIKVSSTHPCTVLRVQASAGIAGGVATVHVDGDDVKATREVTISSTYVPVPGDRALLGYSPPFGATVVAPISGSGDPTGSIKYGSVSQEDVAADDSLVLALECEEHVTGGMLSNLEETYGLWVPSSGVYSCHLQATVSTEDTPSGDELTLSIYVTNDDDTTSELAFDFTRLVAEPLDRLHASRAAVSVTGGSRFFAVAYNALGVEARISNAQLDVAWQASSDGERKNCGGGG